MKSTDQLRWADVSRAELGGCVLITGSLLSPSALRPDTLMPLENALWDNKLGLTCFNTHRK